MGILHFVLRIDIHQDVGMRTLDCPIRIYVQLYACICIGRQEGMSGCEPLTDPFEYTVQLCAYIGCEEDLHLSGWIHRDQEEDYHHQEAHHHPHWLIRNIYNLYNG